MSNKALAIAGGIGLAGVGIAAYFTLRGRGEEGNLSIPEDLEGRVAELLAQGLTTEEALVQALYESTQAELDNSQQYENDNQDVLDDLFDNANQSQQDSTDAIEDAINDPTDAEKQQAAIEAAAAAAAALQAAADAQKLVVEEKKATLERMIPSISTAQTACTESLSKVTAKADYIAEVERPGQFAGWLCRGNYYDGSRLRLNIGDRVPKLADIWYDDVASSIQVKGYAKVTLYQDNRYEGSSYQIYSDDGSDIRIPRLGIVWRDDSASSLIVEPHTKYLEDQLTRLKLNAVAAGSLARDLQNAVNIQIEATRRAAGDLALLNIYQNLVNDVNTLLITVAQKLANLERSINVISSLET